MEIKFKGLVALTLGLHLSLFATSSFTQEFAQFTPSQCSRGLMFSETPEGPMPICSKDGKLTGYSPVVFKDAHQLVPLLSVDGTYIGRQSNTLGDLNGDGYEEFATSLRIYTHNYGWDQPWTNNHNITQIPIALNRWFLRDGRTGDSLLELGEGGTFPNQHWGFINDPNAFGVFKAERIGDMSNGNPRLLLTYASKIMWPEVFKIKKFAQAIFEYDPAQNQLINRVNVKIDGIDGFSRSIVNTDTGGGSHTGDYAGYKVTDAAKIAGQEANYFYSTAPSSAAHQSRGAVYVIDKTTAVNPFTATGEAPGDLFGSEITVINDINNDGIKDIAVAPGHTQRAGYVHFLNGQTLAFLGKVVSPDSGMRFFGGQLKYLSSFNGDGKGHLAVSSLGTSEAPGKLYVYDTISLNGAILSANIIHDEEFNAPVLEVSYLKDIYSHAPGAISEIGEGFDEYGVYVAYVNDLKAKNASNYGCINTTATAVNLQSFPGSGGPAQNFELIAGCAKAYGKIVVKLSSIQTGTAVIVSGSEQANSSQSLQSGIPLYVDRQNVTGLNSSSLFTNLSFTTVIDDLPNTGELLLQGFRQNLFIGEEGLWSDYSPLYSIPVEPVL